MSGLQFNVLEALIYLLPMLFVVLWGLSMYRIFHKRPRRTEQEKTEGVWPPPPNKPTV